MSDIYRLAKPRQKGLLSLLFSRFFVIALLLLAQVFLISRDPRLRSYRNSRKCHRKTKKKRCISCTFFHENSPPLFYL